MPYRHANFSDGYGQSGPLWADAKAPFEGGPPWTPNSNVGAERYWCERTVYETGWNVLPAFQGRGLATAAASAVAAVARRQHRHPHLHAFPATDHPASNAVCRKAGFALLGPTDIEYPPGAVMRCNDWRLELQSPG